MGGDAIAHLESTCAGSEPLVRSRIVENAGTIGDGASRPIIGPDGPLAAIPPGETPVETMTTTSQSNVLAAIIAGGESYYTEFKGCWSYGPAGSKPRPLKEVANDIAEAVVAFANSDGGDVLIGVEDDGAVTGLAWDGDKARFLVQAPQSLVLAEEDIGVQVKTESVGGHQVLWFRVSEYGGSPLVTAAERCLQRRRSSSVPVPPAEIARRKLHRLGDVGFESEPVKQASVEDLDQELVRDAVSRALPRAQFRRVEDALRYWNLIEQRNGSVVLRRAGLLLFAREPLRWHANNRLRIRRVLGEDEGFGRHLRTREHEVAGPIATLLDQAHRFLLHDLLEIEARQESLFGRSSLLPRDALDECLVNAVAHRNYAIEGQAIEVLLYPDRVEIRSPGTLPEPITIKDLRQQRGVHRSRNPVIMRVLRDLGWARDQGEGMRRIFGAMRQVELDVPELEEQADTFIVRLSTRSIYDDATQGWLAAYGPFGLRPEDRKYLVHLRSMGGRLSVDRLARALDESYDAAKKHLARLERQGIVWHKKKTRTYRLVEPDNVIHERAFLVLDRLGAKKDGSDRLRETALRRGLGLRDARTLDAVISSWLRSGILKPAGKEMFALGTSFLEYAHNRPS